MNQTTPPPVLILGLGWLGKPLALRLLAEGHSVSGTVSSPDKCQQMTDLGIACQPWLLGEPLPGKLDIPETVALTIPPGATRNDDDGAQYARGLAQVAKELAQAGARNLLYTSSTSVYGDQEGWLDEEAPLLGGRRSADKVVAAEMALRSERSLGLTVLRLAGLVGGNRHPGRWFAGKENVAGAGEPINLVHRTDVERVVQQVILQGAWGYTFNVCPDGHPSKGEYYPEMARRLGLQAPTFQQGGNHLQRRIQNKHLKQTLHFTFQYNDPFEFDFPEEKTNA